MFFGTTHIAGWSVTYEKAIRDDGTLFFPEKLSNEVLEAKRRVMGSYLFANQYLNIIVPDEERKFRPEWFKSWMVLPKIYHNFAFIDPAIGQKDHNDYTAIVVVSVDPENNWYIRAANRYRLTPSQIVEKIFEVHQEFKPRIIGVEVVAYQEALLYILDEQMRKRGKVLPVKGITRGKQSKNARIQGLVPMFEWGRIFLNDNCADLCEELLTFPRGAHDDLGDSLASLLETVTPPQGESLELKKPHSPLDKDYERWVIQQMVKNQNQGDEY